MKDIVLLLSTVAVLALLVALWLFGASHDDVSFSEPLRRPTTGRVVSG